jgi:AraC family transcriptional regulator
MKGEIIMSTSQNRIDEAVQLQAPRIEESRALLIAGLRGHFTSANWGEIPEQWQRFVSFGNVPGKLGSAHYGVCFNRSDGVDYLSGVEVSSAAGLPKEFCWVSIPAQEYAVFPHDGHVSKLRNTLEAIQYERFPQSGHGDGPPAGKEWAFFERYGEGFDPRTGMGGIEVWIPINRNEGEKRR